MTPLNAQRCVFYSASCTEGVLDTFGETSLFWTFSNPARGAQVQNVEKHFRKCGGVTVTLPPSTNGGSTHRGFGFVQFESREEGEKALQLNGTKVARGNSAVEGHS